MGRDVFSFAQRARLSSVRRGRVAFYDPTLHEAEVSFPDDSGEGEGETSCYATVDPSSPSKQLCRIVGWGGNSVWIECDVCQGAVTQLHLVVDEGAVDEALEEGGWEVEQDVVSLARAVWREAKVPYSAVEEEEGERKKEEGEREKEEGGLEEEVPWNAAFPPFAHQRRAVRWMRRMERSFPSCLPYDGNIRVTRRWYVDTENECFCTDPSPREASLIGGLCADGMGKGKTATALRLVAETAAGLGRGAEEEGERYTSGATLFVLPVNLVAQWRDEMGKFLPPGALRTVFLTSGRELKGEGMASLLSADVVVTTFHFLRANRVYAEVVDAALTGRPRERSSFAAWARKGGKEDCIMEAVRWRRIVVDEVHQTFDRSGDLKALKLFRAGAFWGLSATPCLDNDKAQHLYTFLSREKAHHPNLLSRLIGRAVWRPAAGGEGEEGEEGGRCLRRVFLSAEERLRIGRTEGDSLAEKVRKVTLPLDGPTAPSDRGVAVAERKGEAIDAMRAKLAAHEGTVRVLSLTREEAGRRLVLLRDAVPPSLPAERQAAREAAEAVDRDLAAAKAMQHTLALLVAEREAEEKKVAERLAQLRSERACAVCLASPATLFSTSCYHTFCRSCADGGGGVCPVCGECAEEVLAVRAEGGVGTKLREVGELVCSLGEAAILFVQWKDMLRVVRSFLREMGVSVLALEGNAAQRENTLLTLKREGGVLLLSLDEGFAGLHLPHVSHVIFAHAIVGDQGEVDLLEQQAIARCQRFGQTKAVKTYSFVVADSDEVALYERTHAEG